MHKLVWLALAIILLLQAGGFAADLVAPVSAKDPAFADLRVLDKYGMLNAHENLFTADHPVTRYDIAFELIPTLRSFVALVEVPATNSPEERMRRELVNHLLATLSRDDAVKLLAATNHLLSGYYGEIEELAPGLASHAALALKKMLTPVSPGVGNRLTWHVSVDPNAQPDSLNNPLPLVPPHTGGTETRPFTIGRPADRILLGVRPVDSLEAAVDVTYSGFRLYGTFSTLEHDPRLLIKPDQLSGSAMIGLQFNIAEINDLGITGIVELHILRSSDPTATSSNVGMGGVGIVW